jgi:hypothetical protein
MFPYWLLFSIFAVGAMSSGDRTRQHSTSGALFVLAGILITLMIGLRYQVGGDWGAYLRMYDHFRYRDFLATFSVSGSEPAYSLLNWLAIRLGLGIGAVNVVCGGIFAWGVISFARRQPQPWLALVVGTPFLIIVVGMGYTRQSAALGIFLLALQAVERRRLYQAVFLILLAATFHRTIMVTMPFVALAFAQNRIQVTLLMGLAGLLAYYTLLAPEWDRLSAAYIDAEFQAQGALIRTLMNAIPAAIFLALRPKFNLHEDEKKIWLYLALIGIGSFLMVFATAATVVLDRLAVYIIPIQMFVFSRLPTALATSKPAIKAISYLVVVYSAAVQFVWLNFAIHSQYWLPYRTLLTSPM